jgi:hypothetical protein
MFLILAKISLQSQIKLFPSGKQFKVPYAVNKVQTTNTKSIRFVCFFNFTVQGKVPRVIISNGWKSAPA